MTNEARLSLQRGLTRRFVRRRRSGACFDERHRRDGEAADARDLRGES
jgi:hypothetical protein